MTQQEDRKFNRIQKGKSCVGYAEFKDNCWNFSIISTHEHSDVLTNEYLAGFIQGELQGEDMIRATILGRTPTCVTQAIHFPIRALRNRKT